MKKILENILRLVQGENFRLSILASVALIIAMLDFIGALDNIAWLSERVSTFVLLLLGLYIAFSTSFINDIRSEIQAIRNSPTPELSQMNEVVKAISYQLSQFTSSSHDLRVLEFSNVGDVYNYVADKLQGATDTVEDITWGSYTGYRTEKEQLAYEFYVKTMEEICGKGDIMYKEISSLSDSHYFDRAQNLCQYYSYHLAYHDISSMDVPLISFIIIDSKEVIIGFYRILGVVRALEGIVYLSIQNPLMIKFFSDYYGKIWAKAEKLKEANTVKIKRLEEINNKIHQMEAN
jgi:hypothetical protein